jgi:hypothetical protein
MYTLNTQSLIAATLPQLDAKGPLASEKVILIAFPRTLGPNVERPIPTLLPVCVVFQETCELPLWLGKLKC